MMTMRVVSFLLAVSVVYLGSGDGYCCEAFAPIIITSRHFSSSRVQLHAEQQPNTLLSDLKALQSEEESKQVAVVSSSDYFVADGYNDDETSAESMAAMAEELENINSGDKKLMAASAEITPPKKKLIPKPPPLVFDPLNPKAMVAIVKSFIATDFGIQTTSKVRNNQLLMSHDGTICVTNNSTCTLKVILLLLTTKRHKLHLGKRQ